MPLPILLVLMLAAGGAAAAQQEPPAKTAPETAAAAEAEHLTRMLEEAGASNIDFMRALERHLERYPDSPRRAEILKALAKSAIEAGDRARIVRYGELVIREDIADYAILEKVTINLLHQPDPPAVTRALEYATRMQQAAEAVAEAQPSNPRLLAQWREDSDRALSRAFTYQARAHGLLGNPQRAIELAESSLRLYPTAEAARESARWLAETHQFEAAVARYSDAFTMEDPRNTALDRAKDRQRLEAVYRQWKHSAEGLGEYVLQAYDRTTALVNAYRARLREIDPNALLTDPMSFTLAALEGPPLALDALRGKTIVLDFWATWCGPCRGQHPLYEEVKQRYRDNPDVVFVSVNTDEDRSLVKPFLEDNNWKVKVYFESGLSRLLRVNSIPTTILIGRDGKVASRLIGFIPDRFVDMLSDRIQEALGGGEVTASARSQP